MKDTKHYNKAKHIEIRYLYIRNDMVQRNRLQIEYILGTKQLADILTKQLPINRYYIHYKSMGLDVGL